MTTLQITIISILGIGAFIATVYGIVWTIKYAWESYKYYRDNRLWDEDDDYLDSFIWEGNTLNETDIDDQEPFIKKWRKHNEDYLVKESKKKK